MDHHHLFQNMSFSASFNDHQSFPYNSFSQDNLEVQAMAVNYPYHQASLQDFIHLTSPCERPPKTLGAMGLDVQSRSQINEFHHLTAELAPPTCNLPMHAPVPVHRQTSLLSEFGAQDYSFAPYTKIEPSNSFEIPGLAAPQMQGGQGSIRPRYSDVPQTTFLTPSELLVELSTKEQPHGNGEEVQSDRKSETARKARRRAMTQSIGFVPTDPDTISSHEKKRYYLECLEKYVMYLHEQLSLIGSTAPPLERVTNPRGGLNSRSIRTMLVHMENTTRKLNLQTLNEEQKFLQLRDAVYRQAAGAYPDLSVQARDDGTDMCQVIKPAPYYSDHKAEFDFHLQRF